MRSLAVLAILSAVSLANAQLVPPPVKDDTRPPLAGSADKIQSTVSVITAGGRRLAALQNKLSGRKLLGNDGPAATPFFSFGDSTFVTGTMCPTSGNTPYSFASDSQWGQLIVDRGICTVTGASGIGRVVTTGSASGQVYGAAAQDFGSAKPSWETYGWALFYVDPPPNTEMNAANIQGVSLHVIGNVGLKHTSGVQCNIKGVSVAIFPADQTSASKEPLSTPVHTKTLTTPGVDPTGSGLTTSTFTWSSNSSTLLYTDIVDDPASPVTLNHTTYYWLRIKLLADYAGNAGAGQTGQCFAFWGLSSNVFMQSNLTGSNTVSNSKFHYGRARWQEGAGGAAGYSTTCTGAYTSGAALPGAAQSFWNCWNNGVSTYSATPLRRRCSTYRTQIVPNLAVADCAATANGAQFNDFNFAFYGSEGQIAAGGV